MGDAERGRTDEPAIQDVPAGYSIPGSRLFRAYCSRCQQPMRVNPGEVKDRNGELIEHWCESCAPHRESDLSEHLTPRQRHGLKRTRG